MKKILCYGDSNTFGYNPDGSRYDENTRWTSILQKNLKSEYEVINEGACGRTGFADNPNGFIYSGSKHFPELIEKSDNIDILILWIGTNDFQFRFNISFDEIEKGLKNLIKTAKSKAKKIIIIPPSILNERILEGNFNCKFDKTSVDKSKNAGKIFEQIANINHCDYFDINNFVKPCDMDGLHYDKHSHKLIAEKLTEYINQNISF